MSSLQMFFINSLTVLLCCHAKSSSSEGLPAPRPPDETTLATNLIPRTGNTAPSLLPQHLTSSCQFRCGFPYMGPPYECSCDKDCYIYDDCCADYGQHCWEDARSVLMEHIPLGFSCLFLNGVPLFVVTDCTLDQGRTRMSPHSVRSSMNPVSGRKSGLVFFNDELVACYDRDDPDNDVAVWQRRECFEIETPTTVTNDTSICYAFPHEYDAPKPRLCPPSTVLQDSKNDDKDQTRAVGAAERSDGVSLLDAAATTRVELPESFTVLLNFGPDGELHVFFASWDDGGSDKCEDNEIWDPFAEFCREIYCSANFQLDGLDCTATYPTNDTSYPTTGIYGIDTSRVNLNLTIAIKTPVSPSNTVQSLETQLGWALAPFADVDFGRFTNVSAAYLGAEQGDQVVYFFDVSFVLREPEGEGAGTEPSNDRVVALMTHALSMNVFIFWIGPVQMQVTGIKERPSLEDPEGILKWCRGGTLLTYWNEEFSLQFVRFDEASTGSGNDTDEFPWEMQVHVPELNETFRPHEYLTNILYHGNINREKANVSGTVAVCRKRPYVADPACPRMRFDLHSFKLFDKDNTLIYTGDLPYMPTLLRYYEYEKLDDDWILICVPDYTWYDDPEYGTVVLVMQYANLILTSGSLLAMALSISTYFLFPDLRNRPSKIRLHYTIVLFLFQLSFLLGMRRSVTNSRVACRIVSMVLHYEALATFAWSSVIAWELFFAFGTDRGLYNHAAGAGKRFLAYLGIGYGFPLVVVLVAIGIDYSDTEQFRIGYGDFDHCWLADGLASGVFFGVPLGVSITVNAGLYTATITSIRRTGHSVRDMKHNRKTLNEVMLYARMSAALGFSWIFGLAAVFVVASKYVVAEIILLASFIILNGSQGMMLFFAFNCHYRVRAEYKNFAMTGERRIAKKPSVTTARADARTSDASDDTQRSNTSSTE